MDLLLAVVDLGFTVQTCIVAISATIELDTLLLQKASKWVRTTASVIDDHRAYTLSGSGDLTDTIIR